MTFQAPQATKIEHVAVDTTPCCSTCGRRLEEARAATSLCFDHRVDERRAQRGAISLTLEEIAQFRASLEKKPPTMRERAPWISKSKQKLDDETAAA